MKRPLNGVRVGSTDSDENQTIAEIYAAALERAQIAVVRRMRVADAANTFAALQSGEIDVFPDPRPRDANAVHGSITWLKPAPANDSPCLVTSQFAAEQYWLLRLTKCAAIAPELRLAATPEFLAPGGPLQRLQRYYGGFHFKETIPSAAGTQLYVMNRGEAEVANATTTDPNIADAQLIVLSDDKHFWPERHTAPAVRLDVLRIHRRLRTALDGISAKLTIYRLQQVTRRQQLLDIDPRDVAEEFVNGE